MKLRRGQRKPGCVHVRKSLCNCGHPYQQHTPLVGCIGFTASFASCGCKQFKSSPAIAAAPSAGNAAVRPVTQTADASPGICRICEADPATVGGLCAICAAIREGLK
jgi:hypothetical protein